MAWGDGGRFSGAARQAIFWTTLIVFWGLCLGAQTAQAQLVGVADLMTAWPVILQTGVVVAGTVAIIVRIDESQKQRVKTEARLESMIADVRTELKDIRTEMFTQHEAEEARRTADQAHQGFDKRLSLLEQA